jgi:hypothetical protein
LNKNEKNEKNEKMKKKIISIKFPPNKNTLKEFQKKNQSLNMKIITKKEKEKEKENASYI